MLTIVLIPSIAILMVGAGLSGYLVSQGIHARNFAADVQAALGPTTRFVASAQQERRLTMLSLSASEHNRADLTNQRHQVDATLAEMSATDQRLAQGAPPDLRASLAAFEQAARRLPELRQRVDSGQSTPQDAYTFYDDLLSRCGTNIQAMAISANDASVGFEQMISYDLFRSAEAMSRAHAMAARAVSSGLDPEQFHELAHQLGMYHEQVETLVPRMTQQERARYAALKATPAWAQLVADDNFLMNHGPSTSGPDAVPFNVSDWENSAQQVANGLLGLYDTHSGYAADLGAASGQRILITSVVTGVAVLLVAVTSLLIALRLSRRLIRRLTRLREETLDLADRGLPEAVRRLSAGEQIDVETEIPWLDHGSDEIGQVATAFNAAQRTAINATVRETETRQGTRTVFLNIAHRCQVIVHRQLTMLDEAERSLEDPGQLRVLFQLDHLATRSRRNAENLIILGDGQAGRQWRNPVALGELVRSAVAETEHYTRVDVVRVPDVLISGSAVADLIHLLAELMDNATSFSPPQSRVEAWANVVGRGVVIELEDQGLGMEPEQLDEMNTMLREPPDFGVMALSTEPRIGLFVVARLAARHGIKVTLRDSVYDGIRATVLIPTALTAEATDPDDAEPDGAHLDGAHLDGAHPNASTESATGTTHTDPAWPAGPRLPEGMKPLPIPRNSANRPGDSGWQATARTGQLSVDDIIATKLPTNGHNANAESSTPPEESTPAPDSIASEPPPLPRRNRQANLAPQLRETQARIEGENAEDPTPLRTAEQSRGTMAAFQQGIKRARNSAPDSGA